MKSRELWSEILEECAGYVRQRNVDLLIQKLCDILTFHKNNPTRGMRNNDQQSSVYETLSLSQSNLRKIIQMIRILLCPHSSQRSYCQIWDHHFSTILTSCILPGNHPETWGRIIKTIVHDDLNSTSPYDGSNGVAQHLLELTQRSYTAIASNDRITVQNIIRTTEGKYPLLHVIDELGWNLLHHAAYHSVSSIIEILIAAGLSMNATTPKGETPLHIAAASLRFDSIQTLRRLGAHLSPPHQNTLKSPLQVFVQTLRYSNWMRRLSPHQVIQCIQLLSSSSFDIWNLSSHNLFSAAVLLNDTCELPSSFSIPDQKDPSLFTILVAYTEFTISMAVINIAELSFNSLRHAIFSSPEYKLFSESLTACSPSYLNLLKFYDYMLHTIQATIFQLIRKRKSRILKFLLERFWDYLCIGSTDPLQRYVSSHTSSVSPFQSHFEAQSPNLLRIPQNSDGLMEINLCSWSQYLLSATSSNCLRIVGLLMNALVTSLHSLFNHMIRDIYCNYIAPNLETDLISTKEIPEVDLQRFREILSYVSLKEPFLLVPIFRADSSMLFFLLDISLSVTNQCQDRELQDYQTYMHHCLFTAWMTSPSGTLLGSLPALCIPSLSDKIFASNPPREDSIYDPLLLFLQWCHQSDNSRVLSSLSSLALQVMSPLAAACLMGNTYILQLLLERCVFSTTFESKGHLAANAISSSKLLFSGLNPLCACLFSGSASTMRCMLHYLGPTLFAFLCNYTSQSSPIVPLQLFLSILNIKRKRSFLMNKSLEKGPSNALLYSQIMKCYDDIYYAHSSDLIEIFHMLLTHSDLSSMHNQLSQEIANSQYFIERGHAISSMRETKPSKELSTQVLYSSWEHLKGQITSVSFITKLKITIRNIFTESNSSYFSGVGIPELKTNRHYSNILQATVLLFQHRDAIREQERQESSLNYFKQVEVPKERSKDWWRLFIGYVNDDYTLPLKSSFYSVHSLLHNTLSSQSKIGSKVMNLLLDFKDMKLTDEIIDKVMELLPVSKVYSTCLIPLEELFKTSFQELYGGGILKRKCNNAIELSAVCEVIDTLYKWLMVVIHQHRDPPVQILDKSLLEEIYSMNQLATNHPSIPQSLLHLMLGEYLMPTEIHLTVCLFGSVLKELLYQGHLSNENQQPCQYNNWNARVENVEDSGSNHGELNVATPRRIIIHKRINYVAVLDDLSAATINFFPDDSWTTSCVSHPQGMGPLLCLVLYDCWHAAEVLLQKLFPPSNPLESHDNHLDRYAKNSKILFPGGLKSFSVLSCSIAAGSSYSSLQYQQQRQESLFQYLHYPATDNTLQSLKYCDFLSLAVMKRANSFIISVLPHLRNFIDGEELMRLAYVLDNSILCVQLGWYTFGNLSLPPRAQQTLYFSPSNSFKGCIQLMNHIPSLIISCPNLPHLLASDAWNRRRLTGYHQNSVQWRRIIRQITRHDEIPVSRVSVEPEILARVMLNVLIPNYQENQTILQDFLQMSLDPLSSASQRTPIQQYQHEILQKYGCIPQVDGEYCGLCLSADNSVWLMNGSLISMQEFFSNVSYLRKLLPCPPQNTTFSTQYSALHSLVLKAVENDLMNSHKFNNPLRAGLSLDYWGTIIHGWILCSQLKSFHEWPLEIDQDAAASLISVISDSRKGANTLKRDALGRSSAYIAIASQSIDLSIEFLKYSLPSNHHAQSLSLAVPSKLAQKFLDYSRGHVKSLEESLYSRLHGDYLGNCHGSLIYTLITYLDRLEMLYHHLVNECDMTAYTKMVYDPVGRMVDCLQKSKSCLMLLNFPYSFFTPNKSRTFSKGNQENRDGNTNLDIPQEHESEALSARFSFHDLTPQKLRELYPWDLICQVRSVVYEWIDEKIRAQQYMKLAGASDSTGKHHSPKAISVLEKVPVGFASKLSTTLRVTQLYNESFTEYLPVGENPSSPSTKENSEAAGLWASHIPPFLLAETRVHRKQQNINNSETITSLSKLYLLTKQNPSLVHNSLKTSIVLLEFIRTLCNARLLVSLTTEFHVSSENPDTAINSGVHSSSIPSSYLPRLSAKSCKSLRQLNQTSIPHPLDVARKEVKRSREQAHRVSQYLKGFGPTVDEMERGLYDEFLGSGASTRIKLLDHIDMSQFKLLFEIDSVLSPTFTSLRAVVLSCVYIILKIKFYRVPRNEKSRRLLRTLRAYILESKYNEEDLLFGQIDDGDDDAGELLSIQNPDDLSSSHEGDDSKSYLTSERYSMLVSSVYECLRTIQIDDIALVTFSNPEMSPPDLMSKHTTLIMHLYNYLIRYREIFQMMPQIPLKTSSKDFELIPITECPSQMEISDILNVFSFKLSDPELSHGAKEEIRKHVKSLRCGYSLAHALIEYIVTIIGIHSMSEIYVAAHPRTWKSRNTCNPILTLCYCPLVTTDVPEYLYQRVKYEKTNGTAYSLRNYGFEYQSVECFDKLISHSELAIQLTESLSISSMFSSYSQLDYFIFLCAIFGRPHLLERALAHKRQSHRDSSLIDNHFLVWCVALLAPGYDDTIVTLDDSDEKNILGLDIEQLHPHGRYQSVLLLLIRHGFHPTAPPSSQLSLVDLLSLKRYYKVLLLLLHQDNAPREVLNTLPTFGALHFLVLDQDFPADIFDLIVAGQTKETSGSLLDEPINFSDFIVALASEIQSLGDLINPIMKDLSATRRECGAHRDPPNSSPLSRFDDFMNSEILCRQSWNPSLLLQSAIKSLSLLHRNHSSPRSAASLDSPLASFLSRLDENLEQVLRSNIDVTTEVACRQVVPMSAISWNTLQLAIAATSSGNQNSIDKFLSIWNMWGQSRRSHQVSSDLLHFMCYYGLTEGIQLLWSQYYSHSPSFDPFIHRIFFPPLGNTLNPFEICLHVGANSCLQCMLQLFHDLKMMDKSLAEISPSFDLSSLLNAISTGKGGETMALNLLQLFLDISTPIGAGKSRSERYENMLQLLCSPIDATTLPSRGASLHETIVHLAIRRNYIELIQRLVNIGVNPATLHHRLSPDSDGNLPPTPLEISIALGHREITKILRPFYPKEGHAAQVLCQAFFRNMLRRRVERRSREVE